MKLKHSSHLPIRNAEYHQTEVSGKIGNCLRFLWRNMLTVSRPRQRMFDNHSNAWPSTKRKYLVDFTTVWVSTTTIKRHKTLTPNRTSSASEHLGQRLSTMSSPNRVARGPGVVRKLHLIVSTINEAILMSNLHNTTQSTAVSLVAL